MPADQPEDVRVSTSGLVPPEVVYFPTATHEAGDVQETAFRVAPTLVGRPSELGLVGTQVPLEKTSTSGLIPLEVK